MRASRSALLRIEVGNGLQALMIEGRWDGPKVIMAWFGEELVLSLRSAIIRLFGSASQPSAYTPSAGSCCCSLFYRPSSTSRISNRQPTALAYFLRLVRDGVCRPPDSSRETALLVVPMDSATASCVRPDLERAVIICLMRSYSSPNSSYFSLNPLLSEPSRGRLHGHAGQVRISDQIFQPCCTSFILLRAMSNSLRGVLLVFFTQEWRITRRFSI